MVKYVVAINWLYKPYLDKCLKTLKLAEDNIFLFDGNEPNDPGLAGALNQAVGLLDITKSDWLIVINPAMRFGEKGGLDIIEHLGKTKSNFIFFADKTGKSFAWHCCAIHKDVFKKIGKLDPNFYPVYFEDVDFDLRYIKAFGKSFKRVDIDATNESMNHSVELAGIKVPTNDLIAYFATKWGIHPSAATTLKPYDHPFNVKKNSLAFWPPAQGQVWNE